ncbi:hypothetical protein T09_2731 [Trichinella sp. T9]|nr:hypothetical protein T09_2731 [Trichinella sp. T9]
MACSRSGEKNRRSNSIYSKLKPFRKTKNIKIYIKTIKDDENVTTG